MARIIRLATILFFSLLVLSWLQKDTLPPASQILPELQIPPQQEPVEHKPLQVEKSGVRYTIQPLYSYSLRGLVVSCHDSLSWLDYFHAAWQDHLNVRDLCVLWGQNVQDSLYKEFSFKSGDFTCFFRTESNQAWQAFSEDQISNNHLLAATQSIHDQIARAEPGDQIAFQGYLASYEHDGGFKRGTSTSRTDRGNGACETVFVTHFTMLRKANTLWRTAFDISRFGLAASLLAGLALFFSGIFFPSYATAEDHHSKGAQLAASGRLKPARRLLDKALAMDPQLAEAYRDRALVLERLGKPGLAEEDRKTAQKLEARQNHAANL